MDQNDVFNNLVPQDLLQTNRLPTIEEREILRQSVAPFNAKLQDLGTQISSLKLQIDQMEGELKRLRNEEAAVMAASAAHRRALSPFRTLPDDVVREICLACMELDTERYPTISGTWSMPHILAQISSGMRNIALTTPILWASVHIEYQQNGYSQYKSDLFLVARRSAHRVKEWIPRAGGLALNISMTETNGVCKDDHSGSSNALFDILLSYSARWREIEFDFASLSGPTLARIAALKATDVPLLQSLSLTFRTTGNISAFHRGTILTIPTLKNLFLDMRKQDVSKFSMNVANLTVLHIHGDSWLAGSAVRSIRNILQKTTHLVVCSIDIKSNTDSSHTGDIFLPHLQSLSVRESVGHDCPGLLKFINAPVLEGLNLGGRFSTSSLAILLQQSLILQRLDLEFDVDNFTGLTESLYHCPSLLALSIARSEEYNYIQRLTKNSPRTFSDAFFKAFVCDSERGYLCPRLHKFIFKGTVYASVETIRRFLTGKRKGHGTAGVYSWTEVAVSSMPLNFVEEDCSSQMRKLVTEQRAAGLNVSISYSSVLPKSHNYLSLFTPQVLSILEYLNVGDVLGGVKPAPPTLKTVLATVEAEEAADRQRFQLQL